MSVDSLLADFASGPATGAFPRITRDQVLSGLRERVADPDTINQGDASLCGPASFLYCLLHDNAERYVRYVIDMYRGGSARIGTLDVRPSADCRNATPRGIAPVDWVALASLRDSENTFMDYQDSSNQLSGITMPGTLASWFRAAGYRNVRNDTNVFFTKGKDDLTVATSLLRQCRRICLFINADMVDNPGGGGGFFTIPNHWVVMTESSGISGGNVRISIWTWGRTRSLGSVDAGELTENFFGYVAGIYPMFSGS